MYLWRAVDHEGEVLDILVQRRRDKRAALRLMRKLLKKRGFVDGNPPFTLALSSHSMTSSARARISFRVGTQTFDGDQL
jgi:transposase-like protein